MPVEVLVHQDTPQATQDHYYYHYYCFMAIVRVRDNLHLLPLPIRNLMILERSRSILHVRYAFDVNTKPFPSMYN